MVIWGLGIIPTAGDLAGLFFTPFLATTRVMSPLLAFFPHLVGMVAVRNRKTSPGLIAMSEELSEVFGGKMICNTRVSTAVQNISRVVSG